MDLDLIKTISSLGVGALFGLVAFFFYRADRKTSEGRQREDRKYMEDRLTKILEADQESRTENTKALSELVTLLHRMNGKS